MGACMILCSVATRGRYETTLPLTIMAIINQTKKVDKLVIFDDNDNPRDMRMHKLYTYLFEIMILKGIEWEWVYALRKGQHFSHDMANRAGYEWVFRVDDDCIPEPHVLETLFSYVDDTIGAVGGAILTPPFIPADGITGKIENIDNEPSIQWNFIEAVKEVDHLHCSFLYRAGVHDYNLSLSRVAYREETLFTYGLRQKGYRNLVVPNANIWHLKDRHGGVRTEEKALFDADDVIFQNILALDKKTIVVLDNGLGDHIVFKHVLQHIKNPVVFSCYPDVIPGRSIQEAKNLFGDIEKYNIYRKMDEWKWTGSLEDAFRKMYL
jgi:hypothetical protein